ncbi:MAG TPA: copper resistance protein CopC [Nakamurella multipartita]|nr:copper resistance protein CopC [Nakamurella multipartita]
MSFPVAGAGVIGSGPARLFRRVLLLLVVSTLVTVGLAGPALAHTTLIGSDPADGAVLTAAPTTVTLTFDDPLADFEPVLTVTGPDGVTYQSGSPTVDGTRLSNAVNALPVAGTYTVAYRVVSDDGHPVEGTVSFTLAAQAIAPAPAPATSTGTSPAAGSSTAAGGTSPSSAATSTVSSSETSAVSSTAGTSSTDPVAPAGNSSTGWSAWQWLLVVLFVALAFLATLVVRRRMEASARARSGERN